MSKAFALFAAFLIALTGAQNAFAQASGSYEKGLQMVRESKYELAMAEFRPLAEQGHAQSQFSLGLIYHLGRGVKVDLKVAYDWYKKSAMQENPQALNNIGMMYLNGEYVAQNREVAFKLFEKAAPQHSQAKDNIGQCYENGWGVPQDIAKAAEWYQKSGDEGFVMAYFHLGEMYEKTLPGSPKDVDKAVEWYIKAAEAKVTRAKARLIELRRLPDNLR